MFDVKAAEAEAQKEVAEEQSKAAKGKIIKSHLIKIAAEQVVANLRREYEVLLREIGADVG